VVTATILNAEGYLDPKLITARRNALQITVPQLIELAKAENLDRTTVYKILAEKPRRRHEYTVQVMHTVLKLEVPGVESTFPEHLTGKRWSYHRTHNPSGVSAIVRCLWSFEPSGRCEMQYQDRWISDLSNGPLTFRGSATLEENTRLFCTLQSDHSTVKESVVFLYKDVPAIDSKVTLTGGWFGIDFRRKISCGPALLSKKRLKKTEIKNGLAEIQDFFAVSPARIPAVREDLRSTRRRTR
jgi:hypothetical protein